MADASGKGKLTISIWVVITVALSMVIGGAGWINSALQARAESSLIENAWKIRQLENEDDRQNAILFSNTANISDLKTELTDRLGRIETMLTEIKSRLR